MDSLAGKKSGRDHAKQSKELKAEGYDVAGPIRADSVFHQAAQGKYTSVLSLYHDQGHIAARHWTSKRRSQSQNGMPILRTSVDPRNCI